MGSWPLWPCPLTSDPWTFAWTSRLSRVITPDNFRMIRWQEHCQKGLTDGLTDGQTNKQKLEQLECLRSEDTPRHLMITNTIESCGIPSKNKVEWPWRYRSRSKVITCDTPSHASDHLYQIWNEPIQNCRRYRADTIFKVKAEWPWKYRSRLKVITCDTPSDANDDLCQIWKECKQNWRFFQCESRKIGKILKF